MHAEAVQTFAGQSSVARVRYVWTRTFPYGVVLIESGTQFRAFDRGARRDGFGAVYRSYIQQSKGGGSVRVAA